MFSVTKLSFLKVKYYLLATTKKSLYDFDFEDNEILVDAFS